MHTGAVDEAIAPIAERMPWPGYEQPTEGRRLLSWRWATTRLERSPRYWLATVGASGTPHLTAVWAVWVGGRLVFSTGSPHAQGKEPSRPPQLPGMHPRRQGGGGCRGRSWIGARRTVRCKGQCCLRGQIRIEHACRGQHGIRCQAPFRRRHNRQQHHGPSDPLAPPARMNRSASISLDRSQRRRDMDDDRSSRS